MEVGEILVTDLFLTERKTIDRNNVLPKVLLIM